MLKYKIQHFFGSQERHDIQLARLELDTEELDEREALENGWLFCREWYQCRSTRLKISEYRKRREVAGIEAEYFDRTDDRLAEIVNKIHGEYLAYKDFDEHYDVYTDLGRARWVVLKDHGVPVAFTKFNAYDGGVESQFTCWNYHEPRMSLGKLIVDYEVDYAGSLGYDHLYIGQGYELGSTYKADFGGFEWWTGSEWSTDRKRYRALCARDSQINTIRQLAEAYNDPCQSLVPEESTS